MTTLEGLLKEAAQDLQRERYARLWRQWRGTIIAGIVLVLCSAATVSGWSAWRTRNQIQNTEALVALLDKTQSLPPAPTTNAKTENSLRELQTFAQNNPALGVSALARLHAAHAAAIEGDVAEAAAIYDAMANDMKIEPLLRDLSKVWSVAVKVDTTDLDALDSALKPLLKADFPFYARARELSLLVALRRGDKGRAEKEAAEIAQDSAVLLPLQRRSQIIGRFVRGAQEQADKLDREEHKTGK